MTAHKERQRFFVTAEIASYCGVSNDGVLRWIKAGKLAAFSTPGGHYRIRPDDFKRFLERYDIPFNESFFDRAEHEPTVLVVDNERGVLETRRALAQIDPQIRVESAADGYSAGIKVGMVRPDVVVIRIMMPRIDGLSLCRSIRENPRTRDSRILVITEFADACHVNKIREAGADRCIVRPVDVPRLTSELREVLQRGPAPASSPPPRAAAATVPTR